MRKTILLTMAVFSAISFAACSNIMVMVGLEKGSPPITDSEYFNLQLDTLMERLQKNQVRRFRKAAVLDFVNTNGKVSELGKYLTSKFGERAIVNGAFRVTPQGQVREALRKLKIDYKGQLTKDEVAQIGSELGADAVVTGVLADLQKGSDVDLSVKAIQPSSGDLLTSASVDIYRSKQVQTLIQQF
ncbi:hypothetical protein MNBD_NITROSPINAE01-943 [hydrothermal vent metagenome]|uniref:FlgO domain-containing protein n=1 Tax=hydrothermal vent metagenome TaxID=652676 RepID=A0A3B1C719_9ZZZZ